MNLLFLLHALNFPLALMLIGFFIAKKMSRRSYFVLRAIISFIVILAAAIVWNFIDMYVMPSDIFAGDSYPIPNLNYFWDSSQCWILFLLVMVATVICYDCEPLSAMFVCTASYCLQHIAFNLHRFITLPIKAAGISTGPYFNQLVLLIMYCLVFIVAYFLLLKRGVLSRNGNIIVENKMQVIVSTIILFFTVFLYKFVYPVARVTGDLRLTIGINIFSMISALLGLLVEFGMYANKTLVNEVDITSQLLHDKKELVDRQKEVYEMINVKSHDLKYHLAMIEENRGKDNYNQIKEVVDEYDATINTGNSVLDVILTWKNRQCHNNEIHMTCMVNGELISFLSDSDIYSLFCNPLDNAIEATLNLPSDKKFINLSIKQKGHNVFIHFDNYYNNELNIHNGVLETTKPDKNYHGYGIKSVKQVVEKYGGVLTVDPNDGVFALNILLPIMADK